MKLIRTLLPTGCYKVCDEKGKCYIPSIAADKVEKFIADVKKQQPQKAKDAELAALIARTKKAQMPKKSSK
tara:strand:+ start:2286 stop:2498 length:213 start_codon:yes stop_codon:yes gene_type:complete